MDRIKGPTAQIDKFGPGKNGWTEGNYTVLPGIPATRFESDWTDNVQEEIARAIEGAGMDLDPDDMTQLYQAIERIAIASQPPLGDYLPLTGGTLTGNLSIDVSATPGDFPAQLFMRAAGIEQTRVVMQAGGVSDWWVGTEPSGDFFIHDQRAATRVRINPSGQVVLYTPELDLLSPPASVGLFRMGPTGQRFTWATDGSQMWLSVETLPIENLLVISGSGDLTARGAMISPQMRVHAPTGNDSWTLYQSQAASAGWYVGHEAATGGFQIQNRAAGDVALIIDGQNNLILPGTAGGTLGGRLYGPAGPSGQYHNGAQLNDSSGRNIAISFSCLEFAGAPSPDALAWVRPGIQAHYIVEGAQQNLGFDLPYFITPGGGPQNTQLNAYTLDRSTVYGLFVDAVSDARLKQNIRDSEIDALEALKTLRLRDFDWRADYVGWLASSDLALDDEERAAIRAAAEPQAEACALVAQEVAASAIPHAANVLRRTLATPEGSPIPEDAMNINLKAFVPYLIRAVQQLAWEIEELRSRKGG